MLKKIQIGVVLLLTTLSFSSFAGGGSSPGFSEKREWARKKELREAEQRKLQEQTEKQEADRKRREQLFAILDEINEETFVKNFMKDKLRNCGYTTLAQVTPDILSCDEVISLMIDNGLDKNEIKAVIQEVIEEQSAASE